MGPLMKTIREVIVTLSIAGFVLCVAAWCLQFVAHSGNKGLRAKTRGQMSQWTIAMEMFNTEYGTYPAIDGTYTAGRGGRPNLVNSDKFAVALTGRQLDGTALPASATTAQKVGNIKLITFHSVGEGEINRSTASPQLQDYFGNTDIAVLYDRNGDGVIDEKDVRNLPTVSPAGHPERHLVPDMDLKHGIRAPVVFYSAGKGGSSEDII